MAQITGTVRKTIFANGGFRVYDTAPHGTVKVEGGEPMSAGQAFQAEGHFEPYKGRMTFKATALSGIGGAAKAKPAAPSLAMATVDGVRAWAKASGSETVAGLAGTAFASSDAAAIDRTMGDVVALCSLFGLARRRAEALAAAWRQDSASEARKGLVALGLPQKAAKALVDRHGAAALGIVSADPWILMNAYDMHPSRCDAIASTLGLPQDCDARIAAGLRRAIDAASLGGHTGVAATTAAADTAAIMGMTTEAVTPGVERAIASGRLSSLGTIDFEKAKGVVLLQTRAVRADEETVARFALSRARVAPARGDAAKAIAAAERQLGLTLDASQRRAVATALGHGLCAVTGGPGTGKTTLTRVVIAVQKAARRKVVLVAPTGRAAKRLTEVTGLEASTIHRALECDPFKNAFKRNAGNPIEADVLIVDETSMIDLELAAALFAAIKPTTSVVLVGDVDQLPSVNQGNVLSDLIESGVVPTARLDVVHRQGKRSGVVTLAHAVNAGRQTEVEGLDDVDVEYIDGAEAIQARVVELTSSVLPAMGYDPDQITVLSPTKKKASGVAELNRALKAAINPGRRGATVDFGDVAYSVGDRVMHVRNDYEKEVFNGEIGVVTKAGGARIEVEYPTTSARYDASDASDIVHAWATTIHKAQGSEMDCVVLVVDREQYNATRKLIYTAITRSKKRLFVLTQRDTLRKAIARTGDSRRLTGLPTLLAKGL